MKSIYSILITLLLLAVFSENSFSSEQAGKKNTFSLLHNSDEIIEVELSVTDYQFTDINTPEGIRQVIKLTNGSQLMEKGAPDVSKITTSIIIPNQAKMELEIIGSKFIDYPHIEMAPSKGNIYRNQNPENIAFTYGRSYKKDAFFPGKLAELRDPYILRDFRAQTIVAYPFQYNPITKVLRVYTHLQIRVFNSGEKGQNIKVSNPAKSIPQEYGEIYHRQFINYKAAKYAPLEESGKMLIICHPNYIETMAPFVAWKTKKGLAVELVAYAASTTGTTATAIKSYVNNYYNNKGLTYLLLVGDAENIPSLVKSGDSDVAYAYVEGNDSYPEFFVGRFSGETNAHIKTQVDRTIIYERDLDETATWLKKALVIASDEGGNGMGDDGESDKVHMQNIREDLLAYTYTDVATAFDPGASASQVANLVNAGLSNINYVGHGSDVSWSTTGFSVSHANNLTNTDRWPFIFDVACVNGNFHGQTCFAEAWARSEHNGSPAGSVAIIASTINQSWDPPMDGQDEMIDILVESYGNNVKRTFGGIAYNGCLHMNDEYGSSGDEMTDTWTTFGDPSVMVRTDIPKTISIVHDEDLLIGMNSLSINCDAENALACLSYEGKIRATAQVQNGTAQLFFEPFTDIADAELTVTGYNKITYQNIIRVIPAEGPYLSIQNINVNDKFTNNNSQLEAGEEVFIELLVKNVGVEAALAINGLITTSDTLVEIVDNSFTMDQIEAGFTQKINGFKIRVNKQIPNLYKLQFAILLIDNKENEWQKDFELTVQAPELKMEMLTLIENGSHGDGNGKLEPGESAYLELKVANNGQSLSVPTTISWISNTPYLTVKNSEIMVPAIEPGSFATINTLLSAHSETPKGTKSTVFAKWKENTAVPGLETEIIIGQPPVFQIGDGTKVATYYPFYNYYKSNKTQMLFLANEFSSGSHQINELYFDLASFTSNQDHRQLKDFVVKITTVSDNEITNNYVETTTADTVFYSASYELADTKGWFSLPIDIYNYQTDGGNLLIEISWGINNFYCNSADKTTVYGTQTSAPLLAYGYSDNDYPANYKNNATVRPNLRFGTVDSNLKQDTAIIIVTNAALQPLNEVQVTIGSKTIVTDSLGAAMFYLAHGTFMVNAEKALFHNDSLQIELNPEQKQFQLSLTGKNSFALTFMVTNNNNPLADAIVKLDDRTAVSDENGKVIFERIPEGSYIYSIEKLGFEKRKGSVSISDNLILTLELVEIPAYTVLFEVINNLGEPLSGIQVLFNGLSEKSNNLGKALFEKVPADSNLLYFIEPIGYYPMIDSIYQLNENVTISLTLNAIPDVSVHVSHWSGNLKYAKVTFQNNILLTNAEGMVRFADVQPGAEQPIKIDRAGYYPELTTISVNNHDVTTSIYMAKKSDLYLTITDGTAPLENVNVTLGTIAKTTTENGLVSFTAIDTTKFLALIIAKEGYYTIEKSMRFEVDKDLDTSFVMKNIPDLELLVRSNEIPLDGARINFNGSEYTSNAEGKVLFVDIPAGSYPFAIEQTGYYTKIGEITIDSIDVQETIDLIAIPDVTFTITHKGEPASGVKVQMGNLQLLTMASGIVLFKDVPAGTYPFVISKDGYYSIEDEISVNIDNKELIFDINLVSVESEKMNGLQIYPNPSNGTFTIKLSNLNDITGIEIHDAVGKLVYLNTAIQAKNTIQLNSLKKGFYIITIKGVSINLQLNHIIN